MKSATNRFAGRVQISAGVPVIDLDAPLIRHRFMEEVASRNI